MSISGRTVTALTIVGMLLAWGGVSDAGTVGYWRMETDTDGGGGVIVPNEAR